MHKNSFKKEEFFDLTDFSHAQIFEGIVNVWEVLQKLSAYVKENGQSMAERTIVEKGAFIKGPAIIGKNCSISHDAYIRENVIIGDNVHIGHGVEVKNSIIIGNTAVAHLNYIGDSIVGSNVNIGGGAKTANFRLDGKAIRINIGKEAIDTKLVKLGAIIGDGSKVGVNAVLNPGTILGKGCFVYPLMSVVGVHEAGEAIR